MFGFESSPTSGSASKNIQEFFATGNTGFQIWQKPQGYSMAYILAIGGGSSGAGGATGAIDTGRTGGGGGGGGGQSRLIIPIFLLPDVLFIQVGRGGLSVAGNTAGNAGQRSTIQVSNWAGTSNHNLVLASGNAAATAPAVAGTAGTGETVFTIANAFYANLGIMLAIAGGNGAAGSNGAAAGSSVTQFAQSITCGGAGGGGVNTSDVNTAGGNITALDLFPAISGGTAVSGIAGNGGNGYHGFMPHFYTCGGAGGGGLDTLEAAGSGGAGGLGSGGGGGGGGTSGGGSGGRGGRGGDGYVSIVCW